MSDCLNDLPFTFLEALRKVRMELLQPMLHAQDPHHSCVSLTIIYLTTVQICLIKSWICKLVKCQFCFINQWCF